MKLRLSALVLACAVSSIALAQKEPAEVTDREIAKYKVSAESECRAGAAGKGDPADVATFCTCLFGSLNKTMTRPEWQQVYFFANKGEGARAREILDPHLQKAECRPQAVQAAPQAIPEKPLDLKLKVR